MSEDSEFGSGIVVCLAKFTEHLWCRMAHSVYQCGAWHDGNEANIMSGGDLGPYFDSCVEIYGSREEVLSHQIMMWMNGASDHFYDLDDKAPEKLKELASLVLEIGHGFMHDTVWTMEHVNQIRDLWKEACLAVDEMLGVKSDWGQW